MLLVSEIPATAQNIEAGQRYAVQVNSAFSTLRSQAALHDDWTLWDVIQKLQSVLDGALETNPKASDIELHRALLLAIHEASHPRDGRIKALGLRVPFRARKLRRTYDLVLVILDGALSPEAHDYIGGNVYFYLEQAA